MMSDKQFEVQCFQSGTMIVTDGTWPHFYVFGPGGENEDQYVSNRFAVCEQLASWLNGGERPRWMDDMERTSEACIIGLDGTSIEAVGPLYDADPPKLFWRTRDDDEAKDMRARLIDRIWLTTSPTQPGSGEREGE